MLASFIPLIVISIVEDVWFMSLVLVPAVAFIAYIFLKTKYTITTDSLKVECGFLFNQQIKIDNIRQIKETNNPISSPALSLDRLEIKFGTNSSVIVSPKDKTGFIKHLQQINPSIEFITRRK